MSILFDTLKNVHNADLKNQVFCNIPTGKLFAAKQLCRFRTHFLNYFPNVADYHKHFIVPEKTKSITVVDPWHLKVKE